MNYSTSQNKRHLLFYTLFLAYICAGIVSILPGPTLPILAQHTGVTLAVAGWVFTASATGFMLGVAIAGVMMGRIGPKYVLMSGLVIMACMGLLTARTHVFPVLLAAQFISGTGFGFLDVSINIIVTLSFEDTLGETLNNLHSSYGIGALLAPLLLSLALQVAHDAIWAYLTGSLAGLAGILLLVRQHIPTLPRQREGSQQQGIQAIIMFKQALLWLMALQLSLYVGAEVGFSNWIVTAVSQSAFIALALAAPFATAFWVGMTIGRLLGAQSLKRGILNEKQLLYLSILGGSASGLIVAAFVGQIGISFGVSLLVGLFFGPIFPGVMAIASRRFVHVLGAVSSVMLISAGVAAMILPVLMGFLIQGIGFHWVMAIPALVCLAIVVPFSLMLGKRYRVLQLTVDMQAMGEARHLQRAVSSQDTLEQR
jgi:fucose permease